MTDATLFKKGYLRRMVEVKAIDNYGTVETDIQVTIRIPYSGARRSIIFDGPDLLTMAEIIAADFVPDPPDTADHENLVEVGEES